MTAAPLMSMRRVGLIGAMLVAIGPVSMALYTPAMTEMVEAFGATDSAVKLTLTLYFGGFACAQLIAGPLSDALGRRPIVFAFMAVYCLGSILALAAPTIELLMLCRFIQGVGASAGVAISRALVRDLYTGEESARVMTVIGMVLAIGPALAPALGGLMLIVAGWQSIFALMVLVGIAVVVIVAVAMPETVGADRPALRPAALASAYREIVLNGRFLAAASVVAGSVGALYAQATFLPFILMNQIGLTPLEFGLSMLFQTGAFFFGGLALRHMMRRRSAEEMVGPGLVVIALGGLGLMLLLFMEPTLLGVLIPVSFGAFGIAFVMPAMTTAALLPFPRTAGSAASMLGFMQMGAGLVVGTIGALMGDPVLAMATLIPLMGFAACGVYLLYRRLPPIEPARRMAPPGPAQVAAEDQRPAA